MTHLLRLSLKHGPPGDGAPYPFSVPQIRTLPQIDVNMPVTFFVGENGSGEVHDVRRDRGLGRVRVHRHAVPRFLGAARGDSASRT